MRAMRSSGFIFACVQIRRCSAIARSSRRQKFSYRASLMVVLWLWDRALIGNGVFATRLGCTKKVR